MPITETARHSDRFVITAEFPATVERVWRLWADARQVERWWGPPGYGATFHRHDFEVPGRSIYTMPGPDGSPQWCGWRFVEIDAPTRLVIDNGFADEQGDPAGPLGWNRFTVEIAPIDGGTRMTIEAGFRDAAHFEQMLGLGMLEGMTAALAQTDAILEED